MMWRFEKYFFLLAAFIFSCDKIHALEEPDSVYVRYNPPTIDELYPTYFFSPDNFFEIKFDSTFMVRTDNEKKLRIVDSSFYWTRQVNVGFGNGEHFAEKADTVIRNYRVKWNNQGHIEKLNADEKNWEASFEFGYGNGRILQTEIRKITDREDSVQFIWNRSGQISKERYTLFEHDKVMDSVYTIGRLFDSKGRIIVIPNYQFRYHIEGTMVYQYLDDGKLSRRSFISTTDKHVIFIDTLVYSFVDTAKTLLRIQHKMKISGYDAWIDIDEETELVKSGLLAEYKLIQPQSMITNKYGMFGAGNYQWEYNPSGTLAAETLTSQFGTSIERTRFYYNRNDFCDSASTIFSYVDGDKTEINQYQKTTTTYYPDSNLIATVFTVQYGKEETKSKKGWGKSKMSIIHYYWN